LGGEEGERKQDKTVNWALKCSRSMDKLTQKQNDPQKKGGDESDEGRRLSAREVRELQNHKKNKTRKGGEAWGGDIKKARHTEEEKNAEKKALIHGRRSN